MSEEKRLVPRRRFKEFENAPAWEQRELGEITDITMGQSPKSINYTTNPNDHILVQGNVDMKKGLVHPRVWTTQVTKKMFANDIILSVRAPVGDVGRTEYNGVIGRGVAAINGNEYIYYLLIKMKESAYWEKYSTGSTFDSINSSNIKYAKVLIPNNYEQEKIGEFFKKLDNLITLHQRKLEKVKSLKKAYLSEMFPAEGERKPKRRFAGFTDDWEQRNIGELTSIVYGGGTPSTKIENYWKGNIPWIQSSDLIEDNITSFSYRNLISKEALNKSACRLIPKNSIAIVTRVGVGKLCISKIPYATSQDFFSLSGLKTNIYFTAYSIYKKLNDERQNIQGTSIKGITKDELLSQRVSIPTNKEQEKTGKFFCKLDNLITLHQQQLEKLKELKKSYLKEMFI